MAFHFKWCQQGQNVPTFLPCCAAFRSGSFSATFSFVCRFPIALNHWAISNSLRFIESFQFRYSNSAKGAGTAALAKQANARLYASAALSIYSWYATKLKICVFSLSAELAGVAKAVIQRYWRYWHACVREVIRDLTGSKARGLRG